MRGQRITTQATKWRSASMSGNNRSRSLVLEIAVLAVITLLVLCFSQLIVAQQLRPRNFASAGEASQALYEAVTSNDEPALQAILGAGPELTSSGDKVEDKLNRERFAQKYREMHRLVHEPDGTTMLYIGAENWPFPVPLLSKGDKWYFDSDAGAQEVLARELGQNETIAIQVCKAFARSSGPGVDRAAAQDPVVQFASTLANHKPADSANDESFHGYRFRLGAGKAAAELLVAYPAEYRSTGVMTFMVTPAGSVYEKDLGPQTVTLAEQVQGRSDGKWAEVQPDLLP